jgi:hypothetical protein
LRGTSPASTCHDRISSKVHGPDRDDNVIVRDESGNAADAQQPDP